MSQLTEAADYQDALKTSIARISYEDSQASLESLYKELNYLIETKQNAAESVKTDMFKSFDFLRASFSDSHSTTSYPKLFK